MRSQLLRFEEGVYAASDARPGPWWLPSPSLRLRLADEDGSGGRRKYVRSHADRQTCRPLSEQCDEWAAAAPHFRVVSTAAPVALLAERGDTGADADAAQEAAVTSPDKDEGGEVEALLIKELLRRIVSAVWAERRCHPPSLEEGRPPRGVDSLSYRPSFLTAGTRAASALP